MSWVLFSILAAVFWAIVNILDKFILTKLVKSPIVPIMILGVVGVIASFFVYLVRGFSELSYFNMALVMMASIFYISMTLFYFKAAQVEEISRVVPLFRLTPFFVLVFAYFSLGETFTFFKYLGIILLIFGSLLISIKGSIKLTFGKSFWFMMVAVVSSSASTVITKYLLNYADFWTIFSYMRIGVFIALIPIFYLNFPDLISTIKKQGKKIIGLLSLNELLNLVGVLFITIAASLNYATLVSALSSLHPFFVLLFAVILSLHYPHILKEEIGKSKLALKIIAIVLIFIGAFLIT